jgi:hypothetical protein
MIFFDGFELIERGARSYLVAGGAGGVVTTGWGGPAHEAGLGLVELHLGDLGLLG